MSEMFGNLYGDEERKELPVGNHHFGLEIDGITECSFAKASGVAVEVEVYSYQEGGVNHFEHQLPTRTKHSNIQLERGVTKSDVLMKWFRQISDGIILKRDFAIILWNNNGDIIRRWNFLKGYPIKWRIGDLDALGNTLLIESIELTHEGIAEG